MANAATPLYAVSLTPHRSLDRRGIRLVAGLAAALALIPGIIFYLAGAWPVVGFMGLDVLALYWALSHSLAAGRIREEIILWRDRLLVRRLGPRSAELSRQFNPFWVRLLVDRDHGQQVTALTLASRADRLVIGSFLGPEDKTRLAHDFSAALHRARR